MGTQLGSCPSPKRGQSPLPTFRPIFGRPFVKRFALYYRSVVCPVCLSVCLSVTFVHCGQTVGRIMQVGLGPGHIVLRGDPAPPPPKGHSPPIFGPYMLRPNGCMHQNATWYGCRSQSRGLCVRWRSSAPPKKGADHPNFRPMFIVAKQLDGSLGTKVGLNAGDSVLDGDPAPLPTKGVEHPPHFSAHFWVTVCKTVRPMLLVRCLSVCLYVCL